MSIENMHYDFKRKFNKIDSQSNRNLLIPEIDWILNEAQGIFIKLVAQPRYQNHLGFETSSRTIEDIRSLVEPDYECNIVNGSIAELPEDYLFYVKSHALITGDKCSQKVYADLYIRQHDDDFINSSFDKSSYEWREVNGVFDKTGIKLFPENFEINSVILDYIRKPKYMHNAKNYGNGSYKLPSGEVLTGSQNCELPDHVHSEIVDIAVLIAAGDINTPDYAVKLNKVKLNQLN